MQVVVSIVNEVGLFKPEKQKNESERHRRINGSVKADFLVGRTAIKNAFERYLFKNKLRIPKKVVIKNYPTGQPYVENYEALRCSIGHSRGLGVGAVAPFRIGVDVEKLRPHKISLVNYIAEPKELSLVENFFGDWTDRTTIIWTIKESVIKALGVGFKMSPKQVRINKRINKSFEIEVLDARPSYWHVLPVDVVDHYISLAYEKNTGQKILVDWDSKVGVSSAKE